MTNPQTILDAIIAKCQHEIDASYTSINSTNFAIKLLELIEETEKAEFEKVLAFFDSAKVE